MTKPDRPALLPALLISLMAAAGCGAGKVDPFPAPGNVTEAAVIMRQSDLGPVVIVFTPFPLENDAPPDGVRAAALRAADGRSCSLAAFHWTERAMAERWAGEQMENRRLRGTRPELVLAGHSLGATTAAETARDVVLGRPDALISLLLTVDAIKTGRIGSAAGVTGAFIISASGLKTNLTAYDSAPPPDGARLLRHANYHQGGGLYHGAAMTNAENHLLADSSGLLNHANADDFAFPMLVREFRSAMAGGGW